MNQIKRYIPIKVYEKINEIIPGKKSEFTYIPTRLDKEKKSISPINVTLKKEHFYCVIDKIMRSIESDCGFKRIKSDFFNDIIGDNFNYIKFVLLQHNIIDIDTNYSKDLGLSMGYRINSDYISHSISVILEDKVLIKKIIDIRSKRLNLVKKSLKRNKDYYFSNLEIDYEGAKKWIDKDLSDKLYCLNNSNLKGEKYDSAFKEILSQNNSYFISIDRINDKDFNYHRNRTNNRLDTNLTNLKKELRHFIKSDEPLYQLDIVCSQPFFLYLIFLRENFINRDVKMYGELVLSGEFYEYFSLIYGLEDRKKVKSKIYEIFYSKNTECLGTKKKFESVFPMINDWIKNQKMVKHNNFSINLQKMESEMCIDIILPELEKNNIDPYTIHDAFIVKEKDVIKTMRIMEQLFLSRYGFKPKIKTEKL